MKKFCVIAVSGVALCLSSFYACDNELSIETIKESASPERILIKPVTVKDRVNGGVYKTSGGWGSGQVDGMYRIVSLTTSGAKKDFDKIVEMLSRSHGKNAISPIGKETRPHGYRAHYDVKYVDINGERAVEQWDGNFEDSVRVSKKLVYCTGWFGEL